MADILKNCNVFAIDLRFCHLKDSTLQQRFYETSVEVTIFRPQHSSSKFWKPAIMDHSVTFQKWVCYHMVIK